MISEEELHGMELMLREGHEWNYMLKKGILDYVYSKREEVTRLLTIIRGYRTKIVEEGE